MPGEHDLGFLDHVVAELFGGVDQHRFQGDHCRGAVLDRDIVGDFQLPDHLNGAISGLGFRGREPGEDGARSVLCVEGIGLADQAPHQLTGAVDFDDAVPGASDKGGQASPEGAGALDSKRHDLPERGCPFEDLPESSRIGCNREGCQDPTNRVQCCGDVNVFVRVDADDHVARSDEVKWLCCCHGVPVLSPVSVETH